MRDYVQSRILPIVIPSATSYAIAGIILTAYLQNGSFLSFVGYMGNLAMSQFLPARKYPMVGR